jgi:hypothetical protein
VLLPTPPFWLQMAIFIILWILYVRFSTRQAQRGYVKTTHGEETRYVKHHLFVVGHGRSGANPLCPHIAHNVALCPWYSLKFYKGMAG